MTPVEYFKAYWTLYTERLMDPKVMEVQIESPRNTLYELAYEIEFNGLKNSDNVAYFKFMLGKWLKEDAVFKKLCGEYAVFAFKKMECKHNMALLNVCYEMLKAIETGTQYFLQLRTAATYYVKGLKVLDADAKKNIKHYVYLLVGELKTMGFALSDIKKYVTYSNDELVCLPVHNHNVFAIIKLTGIRGCIDEHVDGVHLYNEGQYKYVNYFLQAPDKANTEVNEDVVCAAVPLKYVGLHSAIDYTKSRLSNLLELLSVSYATKMKLSFDNDKFLIVEHGVILASSVKIHDKQPETAGSEFFKEYSFDAGKITIDKDVLISRYKAIYQSDEDTAVKLRNAIHWLYKAEHSQTDEDKLLNSWFAMEGLLKVSEVTKENLELNPNDGVIKVIQKVVSSALALQYDEIYWREAYDGIRKLIADSDNHAGLSEELIKRASLNTLTGDEPDWSAFISCIEELENAVNDELIKDLLHDCRCYYANPAAGFKAYQKAKEIELLMIYRVRNLIAHNAVMIETTMDLYARKAYAMARNITTYILDRYVAGDTLEDILVGIVVKAQVKVQKK